MSVVAAYHVFVCTLFLGVRTMNIPLLWALWQHIMYLCACCF